VLHRPIETTALIRHSARVIELAIARDELAATDRTFLNIATRHMELTLKHPAIVTRYLRGMPVAMLFAVTNSRNVSSRELQGDDFLGSHDFLRPPFNHRYATVENSFWLGHG
jgi:hypothetical protein